ncbi:MAG: ATP-binding cassette domain-containing protein [Devosia sp.]|uniref:ABC transporter ATP-binding protein n=1 Tax=Devosia sp. TaxID=1871048 RepID=UPI001A55A331|nr:ATP-binding cassette domain-containing protein [Devosia sp.]MBL8599953.1 ATP-binding cassette domain-containing protein [Devosia sp.]
MSAEAPAALECRDISVAYGEVKALSDVSVAFAPCLIHAVVGQNGAGKTTFARTAAGLVKPQAGALFIGGMQISSGAVSQSRKAGVELVHQSFALPPSFTVAEAMEFGSQRGSALYSRRGLDARWRDHLRTLGIEQYLRARIRDLPVEVQQAVEIARALVSEARVLILDEPTAVLSPEGTEGLFERVQALKRSSVTVIVILHKIREVLAVADTVTVLRGGRIVEQTRPVGMVNAGDLADAIMGSEAGKTSDADEEAPLGATTRTSTIGRQPLSAPEVLTLVDVTTGADGEGPALDGVALAIRQGEVLGVAGVEGNGQRTLVRLLANLATLRGGRIRLGNADVSRASLVERRALGLRIIPFERNVEGLSLSSPLWQNWAARFLVLGGLLRRVSPRVVRERCEEAFARWGVRYASSLQLAGELSGGNAQKVILAREIDHDARLIVAAQPTRGLDVGASAFVWQSLRIEKSRGTGILLVSSDLDELFDICDRIVVMLSGRIVAEFNAPYSLDQVGRAMTGGNT